MAHFRGNVVTQFFAQKGRTGGGGISQMHSHRQLVVIHHDGFRGVARLVQRLRNDGCNLFAHITHTLMGQDIAGCGSGRASVGARETGHTGHRVDASFDQISARHDIKHTRHRKRRFGIDRFDVGMGIRRTQEKQVRLVGRGNVVGKLALAFEQQVVLQAAHFSAAAKAGSVGVDWVVV